MSQINTQNKCSQLFFNKDVEKLKEPLVEIFKMQLSLQQKLSESGKGVDYNSADFKERVSDISVQWRNLTLEFSELLERLPYKEWKTYTKDQLKEPLPGTDESLEIWYEYVDMFHFFINIGLALGINGSTLEHLYVTKNAENFDRQKRGY